MRSDEKKNYFDSYKGEYVHWRINEPNYNMIVPKQR